MEERSETSSSGSDHASSDLGVVVGMILGNRSGLVLKTVDARVVGLDPNKTGGR